MRANARSRSLGTRPEGWGLFSGGGSICLTNTREVVFPSIRAGVAQLVEYKLPKLGVASSILVARSNLSLPTERLS